jgi:putative ABC transport system ATP-binding protein
MTENSVVSARNLAKTYRARGASGRETPALQGVDLDVARGEWVTITGPSGCGKSTLLQLLGGLDRPDRGTVRVGNVDVARLSEARRAVLRRTEIGFVFQFFNLIGDLSVADNVELPMLLVGARRSAARRRRRELLDELGLPEIASASPAELSGGQQQRVAIARALANRPPLLLADEPTGNLDSSAAQQVIDLLGREHARGQTIVVVTHDDTVAAAGDRVLPMLDGRFDEMPATADEALPASEYATAWSPR